MLRFHIFLLTLLVTSFGTARAGVQPTIRGEYLEARTCDVYTGPCFANAEMGLSGKEAVMAWRVTQGTWNNTKLAGLSVAVVLRAESTLGDDGIFGMQAGHIRSVILVDKQANEKQKQALVAFAKASTVELTQDVISVQSVTLSLENNHDSGKAQFAAGAAGKLARIETRGLDRCDCVCTNEIVYYQPLTKVRDFRPAFTRSVSFRGEGLNSRWDNREIRSAFLARFER